MVRGHRPGNDGQAVGVEVVSGNCFGPDYQVRLVGWAHAPTSRTVGLSTLG
jgi:hypothetical protein